MLGNAGTVAVDVTGDFGPFKRQLDKEGNAAGRRFGSTFGSGFGASVAGVVGTYFGARLFQGVVQNASDLNESLSKNSVVFGDNAKAVEQWANTSSKSVLLSKQAAIEAASTYGNLFQGMGLDSNKSADLSKNLVQLAADLASFNNTSVEDAIDALRSGLVGETEPLKRYGVIINETMIKEKARALGLVKGGETLTEQAKLEARYALLLEQTGTAQGDVARTADGYANRLRQAQANWENLQASLGEAVIPVLSNVLGIINSLDTSTLTLIVTVGAGAFAFIKLTGAVQGAGAAFSFLAANPWVLIIGGIAAAVILLAKNWDEVTAAVDRFFAKIGKLADVIPGWLKPVFGISKPVGLSDKGEAWAKANGWMTSDGKMTQPLGPPVPGRATGGPVTAGQPYVVGERRPELFVPNTDGYVLPDVPGMGGGSMTWTGDVVVKAEGDLSRYTQRDWEQVATQVARAVQRVVGQDRRSQGVLA